MSGAPSTYAGVADVVAVLVLLTEFAMLRAPLLRSQVRLYAFQSFVVTVLAVVVAPITDPSCTYWPPSRWPSRSSWCPDWCCGCSVTRTPTSPAARHSEWPA
jgi:hypothetical protein